MRVFVIVLGALVAGLAAGPPSEGQTTTERGTCAPFRP